ncbi:MAG: radical SAM protein [Deltaproteobacteria bacterium CG11_big_fil_rev_8_21_14_0_20_49_13]|nr:MAG: radical SAM protein [Deltaproteobacteria bacterium CG11_big_fil_rev_8_21_14_0_20_49_13]
MRSFENNLVEHRIDITHKPLEILQVNVGKLCNQACHHCHVEAGPKRTEIMEKRTVDRLIELLDQSPTIYTVDITGGAPELNPHFRTLVAAARQRNKEVIDRCNLTVFFEKGQEETAHFLKAHQVKVVASLPCYSKKNVDAQRGGGVFDKSIRALLLLNELGYGKNDSGLTLDLVYNPLGAFLPPSQEKLELDYKKELHELFGIEFNHLFTITNMPIKRFLDQLVRENKYEEYMTLLANNFNATAASIVMCRNLISIGWDGNIYDCDFNQMLDIPSGKTKTNIWDIETFDQINKSPIAFANHCYGCTAGAGSSCGGKLI